MIGAGQGKRLLPLTEEEPKALLNIGGKSLLEWQVTSLIDCGVEANVFLAGFNLPAVERSLAKLAPRWTSGRFRAVSNPLPGVAHTLAHYRTDRNELERESKI